MKHEGIYSQDEGINPHISLLEGYDYSQKSVELNNDEKYDRVREKYQARQQEVGLGEVPLLKNIKGDEPTKGYRPFW